MTQPLNHNTGHGHVRPRPDGVKARCGGPQVCDVCAKELAATVEKAAPADPMDWPLPCDVRVGHGTMRKGVKLRTLVTRMKVLYEMATGENADAVAARKPEQGRAMLDEFLAAAADAGVTHLSAQQAAQPVAPGSQEEYERWKADGSPVPDAQPVAGEPECVVCTRCGHNNWIQDGKAPCEVNPPTATAPVGLRTMTDGEFHALYTGLGGDLWRDHSLRRVAVAAINKFCEVNGIKAGKDGAK